MTLSNYMPMDVETRLAFDRQNMLNNHQQGTSFDPQTLANLHSINKFWGWMDPGAQLSLAKAGFDGQSPAVAKAAQLSMTKKQRDTQFQQLLHSDPSDLSKIPKSVYNSLSPDQRDQLKQQSDSRVNQGSSGGGGILGDVFGALPVTSVIKSLSEGDYGGALENVAPGVALYKTLRDQASQSDVPGVQQAGGVSKDVAREAGVVAQAPLQYVQGSLRNKVQDISDIASGNITPANVLSTLDPSGAISQITHYGETYKQTTVGQQGIAAAEGRDPLALGNGILPDPKSPIARAQAAATRAAAPTIGGHAWTPGRQIANLVSEPDSGPFDVISGGIDATVALQTDPVLRLMQAHSEARQAQKFFAPDTQLANDLASGHGVLLGPPEGYEPNTARAWLTSPEFNAPAQTLADTSSAAKIWRMTGRKLSGALSQALAAESDPEQIKQIMLDHVGPASGFTGPTNVLTPGSLGYKFTMGLQDNIFTGMFPEKWLQPGNPDLTVRFLADQAQGAHIPINTADKIIDQYLSKVGATDPNADMEARIAAIDAHNQIIHAKMVESGTPAHIADDIMGAQKSLIDRFLGHNDVQISSIDDAPEARLNLDGNPMEIPSRGDVAEFTNKAIQAPSPRDIRSATSKYANIFTHPAYKGASGIADAFMNEAWKPFHLLRPALILRIMADTQANIAARGFEGLFNHPLNWISLQVGQHPDSGWANLAGHIPGVVPGGRYLMDAVGDPMMDMRDLPIVGSMYDGLANISPIQYVTRGTQQVGMDHPLAAKGLVENMQQMASDPIVRFIMNQPSVEEAKVAFANSELRNHVPADFLNNSFLTNGIKAAPIDVSTPEGSDAFVDSVFNRVRQKTGEHGDLIEAVRSGKLRNASLWKNSITSNRAIKNAQDIIDEQLANPTRAAPGMEGPSGTFPGFTGGPEPYNPRRAATTGINSPPAVPVETTGHGLSAQLGAEAGHEVSGPGVITPIGQEAGYVPALPDNVSTIIPKSRILRNREAGLYKSAVQTLFNHMLTNPDVKIDRIPAYIQNYWGTGGGLGTNYGKVGTIEHYVPYLNDTDRAAFMETAKAASLPDQVMNRLNAIKTDTGAPRISLVNANMQAKADALDNIVNMVHDLHSRSQFGDMTRLLFPFGDAFRRIATRWAKTVWENPEALQKFYLGLNATKSSGFFHTDPITGGMVFTVPGSDWLTDKLIGVPIPLQSQVNSLSMVGEGIPGVGPAVTIPAQYILPDTPKTDTVRDLIWPMGRPPADQNIVTTIGENLIPAYLQNAAKAWAPLDRFINGPPDPRTYATTVGSMMKYLASTGAYNLHGQDAQAETARMMQDAKDKAKYFYLIRGISGSTLPAPTAPNYQIKDKTGHLQTLGVVTNDYYKQEQKLGPDGALNWLIQHYGEDNIFVAQSFSQSLGYAVPITTKAYNWVRENPSIESKYPLTYGLYAPPETTNNLDITALNRQYETGQRAPITPEKQVQLANTRVGLWIYHQARDQILQANGGKSLNSAQSDILNGIKQQLMKEYPGFGLIPFDTSKLVSGLAELQNAAKDPAIKNTDAGQGLAAYFAVRQEIINAAPQFGKGIVSPFRAKATKALRDILRAQADSIIAQHPSFAPMWNEIFSHEMAKDA